jgi:hypothetical protein
VSTQPPKPMPRRPLLGEHVRDTTTGVTGVVVGIVTWLHSPAQTLIVQPPANGASVPGHVYVHEAVAEPWLPEPPRYS